MTDTTQQPTGAELERARSSEIIALGQQYAKYLGPNDAAEAVRTGKSVDQFRDAILAKVYARHETTQDVQLDMPKADAKRYSLGRALLASVTGDWSQAGLEREASAACAKLYGRTPEGFYVPFDVFKRDFNVGTATEAGNLVPTDLRTDLYVDALRNAMVLGRMNARILTGLTSSIDIPRKTTPSTVGFLTEIGSAAETNPVTTKVTLQPHRIGGYVEVSKQALIQSAMALEPMLRDDLITSAALQFEARALVGTGTAASDTDLRSLLSGTGWTGLGTVTEAGNGTSMGWSEIVALETAVATANAEPDTLAGYVINTRTRGKAKTTQRGTNLAFCWDNGAQPLNGYRAGVSNAVPSNLTKGTSTTICSAALFASDWSMLVLATFGGLDVTVDPYTKADTGQVKITLNQFVDLGVRQPAAFAYRKDLLTT